MTPKIRVIPDNRTTGADEPPGGEFRTVSSAFGVVDATAGQGYRTVSRCGRVWPRGGGRDPAPSSGHREAEEEGHIALRPRSTDFQRVAPRPGVNGGGALDQGQALCDPGLRIRRIADHVQQLGGRGRVVTDDVEHRPLWNLRVRA